MNNMFTDNVKRMMEQAREESARLGHNYIGTEHLLLGLIRIDCSGARALVQMGLGLAELGRSIDDYVISSGSAQSPKKVPFTPRAKNILILAASEAKELNSQHTSTSHMILALVKDEEGVAAQVLDAFGVSYSGIRNQIKSSDE